MSETYAFDNLIAGDHPIVTSEVTVLTGNNLAKGTVLGKITAGTVPTTGTKTGTGDGTMTAVTGGVNVKPGSYVATVIQAITNGGIFKVVNPLGKIIGQCAITAGAGGTGVFVSDEINFTITDGSTDFILGDLFTVVVPAGSGKFVAVNSTLINGAAEVFGVLMQDADASSGDIVSVAALCGEFNANALVFGGSDTAATRKTDARAKSIYFVEQVKTTGVHS